MHTDFGEFNSDIAVQYFSYKGITWKSSISNEQQQNKVVKCHIRTVIKRI